MSLTQIKTIEHLKKDETIINGIYHCPKCEVIFSAYYLRTFSINCLRSVIYGKCSLCENGTKRKEKKLSNNVFCLECKNKISNVWGKMCGDLLVKMQKKDFEKFCVKTIEMYPIGVNIDILMIESLYRKLSKMDFLSIEKRSEVGYSYFDISTLIKEQVVESCRSRNKKLVNFR